MKAIVFMIALAGLLSMTACSSEHEEPYGPDASPLGDVGPDVIDEELRDEMQQTIEDLGLNPLGDPPKVDEAKVALGHQLFFDPILSGSKDVNCATCHHMDRATTDEFALSAGTNFIIDEFGHRRPGPQLSFTPRTSTELFNLGHEELRTMFWDVRLEKLEDGNIVLHEHSYPKMEGNYLRVMPEQLDSLLAAQAMLPVHSRNEMRGADGAKDIFGETNETASVPNHHFEGTWKRITDRLVDIPAYVELFDQVYPELDKEELNFAHAANALAAFQIDAFTFPDSPWDDFVDGDDEALTNAELRGADLFFGEAQCATCHGGDLFTDQRFYNLAVPPMTRGPESLDNMDLGAAHRSHAGPDEEFHFRTPPLRNVELTGPYMHNGAYATLEEVIRHKIDPVEGLWNYAPSHLTPAIERQVHSGENELARVQDTLSSQALIVPELSAKEIDDLIAFMKSLTSPSATDLEHLDLEDVPSGLPLPNLDEDSAAIH